MEDLTGERAFEIVVDKLSKVSNELHREFSMAVSERAAAATVRVAKFDSIEFCRLMMDLYAASEQAVTRLQGKTRNVTNQDAALRLDHAIDKLKKFIGPIPGF